jgi:hypothetical protein
MKDVELRLTARQYSAGKELHVLRAVCTQTTSATSLNLNALAGVMSRDTTLVTEVMPVSTSHVVTPYLNCVDLH